MASTFTGTVSRVKVDSAETLATLSLVDESAEAVDNRDHVEQPWAAQPDEAAEAQHRDLFPLVRNADGKQKIEPGQRARHQPGAASSGSRSNRSRRQRKHKQRHTHTAQPHLILIRPHSLSPCFLETVLPLA
jgi:hypothetical protein